MIEENAKIKKIQKSCKVANIVSKIFMIIAIIGCTICLITGIVILTHTEKYDKEITESLKKSQKDRSLGVGGFRIAEIRDGELVVTEKMTSSVPSIQKYFDEHQNSAALPIGFYLLMAAAMCGMLAFALSMLSGIFGIIVKEGNPFVDKVKKKVFIAMIIISALVTFTAGAGFGALLALLTWVVYTIIDYGCTLKTLSDETL